MQSTRVASYQRGEPNSRTHFRCSQFPSKLLERDPAKRFCCKPHGEGFQEFQRHPWFKPIDWETLENKTQTPPFVPDVRFITFLRMILVQTLTTGKESQF